MLNAMKHLDSTREILRCTQDDTDERSMAHRCRYRLLKTIIGGGHDQSATTKDSYRRTAIQFVVRADRLRMRSPRFG